MSTSLEMLTGNIADRFYAGAPQPRQASHQDPPTDPIPTRSEVGICPSDQLPCPTDGCPTPCLAPYHSTEDAPKPA